ncbi:MAG: hypothetical protein LUF30_12720 [Lachnospiraceae bacterium]|nr:hypothetical protein [Lachnospiraceae bacterium]
MMSKRKLKKKMLSYLLTMVMCLSLVLSSGYGIGTVALAAEDETETETGISSGEVAGAESGPDVTENTEHGAG